MLKLILVDDEAPVREALAKLLKIYQPEIKLCASCASLSSAINEINVHEPDILLLDIELASENGFDLFKSYPNPKFHIIFITAYQQYAVKAFRFAALDYLLKPVDPDLLSDSLEKAKEFIDREKIALRIDSLIHNIGDSSKKNKKVVLKTSENVYLVNLSDIVYCEADRSYTSFYLVDKSRILVSTTLGDYEELFDEYDFFRIHQSYLLNLNYFKRYEKSDGGRAILTNNVSLPVSTRKKEQLMQRLSEL